MLNLKKIEIEVKERYVTVWLNQQEIRNALSLSMIEELIKAFKWINEKKEILVILIRGRGNSFCAGADINWMINSGSPGYRKSYRDSKKLASCFKTIYQSDKVVISLIHGEAFGGALGFSGAGDLTFAVNNTRFCLPELRLGLIPSVIMPYLLTRVKQSDLKYQIFRGGIFSAEEALKIGLIDKACEDIDDMEIKAYELIQNICSESPQALTEVKRLIRTLNKSHINSDNIKETVKVITKIKRSDDARRRMLKFITKK